MELDYNRIDPELLPALDNFPGLDITRENIADIRVMLGSMPAAPSPLTVMQEQIMVQSADGEVAVYVYRKSNRDNQPAVLWIHGGGYLFGSAEDERARVIADRCDCTVVSVDYRMAPEHPFPAGSNDCYAVLEWMYAQSAQLNIDKTKIAIGGASAGSGMAAGVVLMNRDKANHPLKFQLLIYPMIDNLHATPSGQIDNNPVWNKQTSFNAWEMYLGGVPGESASPHAAASRASDLRGLPPAYICVGTADLFCDEDIDYARRLSAAGVPVELAVFPGVYHAAETFAPTAAVSKRMTESFLCAISDALS